MSEPFIAEIRIAGFNFAPRGWAFCNGQILPINQNTALFSLLGTTYGGNGQTTFALPNLQGRAPMHPGQGPGLTPRVLGEMSGTNTVTLISTEIPNHTHQAVATNNEPSATSPANAAWASLESGSIYRRDAPDTAMSQSALAPAGGGQPHNNMQPYLGLNFIIALQGIFPSRN